MTPLSSSSPRNTVSAVCVGARFATYHTTTTTLLLLKTIPSRCLTQSAPSRPPYNSCKEIRDRIPEQAVQQRFEYQFKVLAVQF